MLLAIIMLLPITYVITRVVSNSEKLLFTAHYARFYMLQEKLWETLQQEEIFPLSIYQKMDSN